MSPQPDDEPHLLGTPERLAFGVVVVGFIAAAAGLAWAAGTYLHPVVGWFVATVVFGVPTSWLARKLYLERERDLADARMRRAAAEEVPAELRQQPRGVGRVVRSGEPYRGDDERDDDGAPRRTW